MHRYTQSADNLDFPSKLNDSWLYGAVLFTVTGFSDDVF